jgi:hypothetical protein
MIPFSFLFSSREKRMLTQSLAPSQSLGNQFVNPGELLWLAFSSKKRNHQPGLSSGYKRFPLPFHFEVEMEEKEMTSRHHFKGKRLSGA